MDRGTCARRGYQDIRMTSPRGGASYTHSAGYSATFLRTHISITISITTIRPNEQKGSHKGKAQEPKNPRIPRTQESKNGPSQANESKKRKKKAVQLHERLSNAYLRPSCPILPTPQTRLREGEKRGEVCVRVQCGYPGPRGDERGEERIRMRVTARARPVEGGRSPAEVSRGGGGEQ
ncbi:hypothetical protein K474DRAFT_641355 [Panus rudis PR-1116 ss-1]|nr:hypothetical protein K474DRAFT_641355 [Panus rudis PR-1116 ss-1]